MATRRDSEAARVLADLYRLAQERIGLNGSLTTLHEWRTMNERDPRPGPWVARVVRRLLGLRQTSRLLARRYYNLSRAISGGQALPNPKGAAYPSPVPLTQLLDDFGDVVDDITAGAVGTGRRRETRAARRVRVDPSVATDNPAREDTIRERVDDLTDELDKAIDAFEKSFRRELDVAVEVLEEFEWPGEDPVDEEAFEKELTKELDDEIARLRKEIERIEKDEELKAEEQRKAIADKANSGGYGVSGVAGQGAIDTGRQEVDDLAAQDALAIGWMRITGPRPCAFCAMLASRGVVYKSESTGRFTPGLGNRSDNRRARAAIEKGAAIPLVGYHPNCMCEVVPVFNDSPIFSERDKFFDKNWGPVTKGKKGRDALNAWRTWLTAEYKAGRVPDHEITKT